ncbi:S9 family peptidase [Shewanella surugensis]|uniref:S9 family peptidase n=1 Tax=Shewanella surugensis TaxID=212020 RepID=A0ABT0LDT0_9GAMM|nr:S9 family peptidase [Shewanella surugensis]MCL1125858.1 S9 family peptidase [Shewanella surugensis]
MRDSDETLFKPIDVFNIEYASDMTISDDGLRVYFVRNRMDINIDRQVKNIWSLHTQTKILLPVTSGIHADFSPALSPDQKKLAFISTRSGKPQIFIKWLDTGEIAMISHLNEAPSHLSWSPDNRFIAFNMFVPSQPNRPVKIVGKPKGATWADEAVVIDELIYRQDGAGYTRSGFEHIFMLATHGGNAQQLTKGDYDHNGEVSWAPNAKSIYFSAQRFDNLVLAPIRSEIYRLDLDSRSIIAMTDRNGPDNHPQVSPNGQYLAYLGFDDKGMNYDNSLLYVKSLKDGKVAVLAQDLDRNVSDIKWGVRNKGLYIQYDDKGSTSVAFQPLRGKRKLITNNIGNDYLGRPYSGGNFDVAHDGTLVFTQSDPQVPAEIGIVKKGKHYVLTQLNQDALSGKTLAKLDNIQVKSSHDGLAIQGWILYPPHFDSSKKYPLILEIHGGPAAAYGPHFSAEDQLYAAAGYVVLYMNPRGSTSYGAEFAQKIHHAYPSYDYDDLMTGVDALIAKGFIDEKRLFVTGGSGGGVLTAWIIGHTKRFAAAVVAKPVINWFSFVLTADHYPFFAKYWFDDKPWNNSAEYMKRSPISYVGNMETPTMLFTGEEDHRTPISESEQLYQALKLKQVDTVMVRIPNASHSITARPSNLITKVAYILWWFEKYGGTERADPNTHSAKK